ncbi:Bax inhibitor-1/YccA family protein, partial [bacterium]|nr:Bax inhibitor-1/YccA family protein [bacterium]
NIGISLNLISLGITIIALIVYIYVLMCDFRTVGDYIEMGMPKEYEWYLAYSILLTLIIIYIEILKLLARSRKK